MRAENRCLVAKQLSNLSGNHLFSFFLLMSLNLRDGFSKTCLFLESMCGADARNRRKRVNIGSQSKDSSHDVLDSVAEYTH